MNRRYDIDALRIIAFAFLILYHVGMLYVADWGNGCLRRIETTGQVSLLAGNPRTLGYLDGPAATSVFSRSAGIAVLPSGALLYVADSNNRRIRQLTWQ